MNFPPSSKTLNVSRPHKGLSMLAHLSSCYLLSIQRHPCSPRLQLSKAVLLTKLLQKAARKPCPFACLT